jgi:hypothetical protein
MANFSTDKEIQEFLEKQERWYAEGTISQQEYSDAVNDAKVGVRGYTARLKASGETLTKSFMELGSSMASGAQGASVYNNALNSGADYLKNKISAKWGLLGDILGGVIKAAGMYASAVNEQADKLFDTYKDLSRSGLATGMQDTFKNLQSMGYTMAEIGNMKSLLVTNANTLAQFGGTAAEGSKKFAALSKGIVDSNLGIEFQRMGMSIDDINQGIAGYTRLQQMSGQLGKQTAEEMQVSAAAFIEKQDQITRLTGLAADAQNKLLEQSYSEERFAAKQYELRVIRGDAESLAQAEANDKMNAYFSAKDPEIGKAFRNASAGYLNEPAAQKFNRDMGNYNDLRNKGVTEFAALTNAAAQDATRNITELGGQAMLGNFDRIHLSFAGQVKMSNDGQAASLEESNKRAKQERDNAKAGKDAGVAAQVGIRTNQRNQTQTTDLLTNKGIVPVTEGMAGLAGALTEATDIVGQLAGKSPSTNVGGNKSAPASAPSATPSAAPTSTSSKTIGAESGGVNGPNKSGPGGTPTSSAYGVGQMLKGTFNDLASKAAPGSALYGKTYEDMKKDANLQIAATNQYESDNRAALSKAGLDATDANVYLAHFLGTTGAIKLLKANDMDALTSVVSEAAIAANPNLKSMATVGDLKKWAASKMSSDNTAQATTAKKQSAASGGILSGPKSGYTATLHGTEAVVPLPDGKTIPVQIQGNRNQHEQIELLSMELDKLDSMLRVMQKQNDISHKILQRQV